MSKSDARRRDDPRPSRRTVNAMFLAGVGSFLVRPSPGLAQGGAGRYANMAHSSQVKGQSLTGGGYGLNDVRLQHTVQSWAVAGQDSGGPRHGYYMIEVDSAMRTGVAGTFRINRYDFDLHLVDDGGKPVTGTELIAATPDTIQGSTSYTTTLDQSVSASGGFFGDTPTQTLGNKVSFGHKVSRPIPDIAVNNRSRKSDGQNASWSLELAESAPAQHETMVFTSQALFRTPAGPQDKSRRFLKLDFMVAVEDHDSNGTGYYDKTAGALAPVLGNIQLIKLGSRGCFLKFPSLLYELKSPAIPK